MIWLRTELSFQILTAVSVHVTGSQRGWKGPRKFERHSLKLRIKQMISLSLLFTAVCCGSSLEDWN